jgi:hypothetical protein
LDIVRAPLDGRWVEQPLLVEIGGRPVTGIARANWGAIEVRLTSPLAHASRGRDSRGAAFALAATHQPSLRFAVAGELTHLGQDEALRYLTDLYLDALAVSRHRDAIEFACRQARRRLQAIDRSYAAASSRFTDERAALRRDFKAGWLTQQEYQRRRKELAAREARDVDAPCRRFEAVVHSRFRHALVAICGRSLSLADAEALLAEPAGVASASGNGPQER